MMSGGQMDEVPACDGGSMEVTPAEVILSDDNFEEPESVALKTEDPSLEVRRTLA